MKKLLTGFIMATLCMVAGAQTPIPLYKEVRHGVLPNGLNYYILHNEEPKERVNFYIAQKVGSTLENEDQLGLAHFLEHMAFNGTKNYPGKNMLNYLQSKGIRFGADINAYTGFDETVYRINNVPTTDQALMDSVLLVLADWSGDILLEESEIEAERGVIQEEWRSRNDANTRMLTAILPMLYQEPQYQQMPIGKMEVVMNFKPEALRAYYKKWYRPDQQGIVIVGDVDVDQMEAKVKDMFSKYTMPENAAPRIYPQVSDNEKPIYAYFDDTEMPYTLVNVSFKSDKIPTEYANTMEAFVMENVVQALIAKMINNRLDEYSKNPECAYSQAGVDFGDYWVSKTKGTFDIQIIVKNNIMAAYKDAMAIVARACKTGFMPGEVVRARDEIIANYEKLYNERNSTNSNSLAQKIIRTFIDNKPYMGQEQELNTIKMIMPNIPVDQLNLIASQILTPENQVILVARPRRDGMELITEQVMTSTLNEIINAEYEAYVDEELPESLIENLAAPGSVTSTKEGAFGTTEMMLSNGVKVVVKPTDFKADEIIMTAFREGGRQIYAENQASDVNLTEDAYSLCKLGNYTRTTVDKYLAGKKVKLGYNMGNSINSLVGNSTVKDIEKMMELVYLSFTALQPDEEAFKAQMDAYAAILAEQEKNPNFIFQSRLAKARACGSALYNAMPSSAMLAAANDKAIVDIICRSLKNAADYTFVFTGNITADALKPLLEKYIANLPSTGKSVAEPVVTPLPVIIGIIDDKFEVPMETPSTQVFTTFDDNNLQYSIENSIKIDAIGDILDIIYTETLREEEGGTYSPQAFGSFNPWSNYWSVNYWFQTNADIQDKLINRANDEFMKLLNNGTDAEKFNKVKEAMLKQYDINIRTNKYWDSNLVSYLRGIDNISTHKTAIKGMTLENLNTFMKSLYNGKNRLNFVMTGVPMTK